MDNKKLAEMLFPNITKTPEDYEKIYPERNLPDGAVVTLSLIHISEPTRH